MAHIGKREVILHTVAGPVDVIQHTQKGLTGERRASNPGSDRAQEDWRIEIDDEGIRLAKQRGSGFIRWTGGVVVRRLSSFVLEEEGEQVAVIPRRYLKGTELMLVHEILPGLVPARRERDVSEGT